MTQDEFLRQLAEINQVFYEQVHSKMVKLINEYKEQGGTDYYSLNGNSEVKQLDDMALLTAWVIDHLNNKQAFVDSPTYNKTVTKKVRKALGYIY